jgi:hypothetical protein
MAAWVLPTRLGFWPRIDLVVTLRQHSTETKSLWSGTSWGCGNMTTDKLVNHAEPDVASFQMMANYLATSVCPQFVTWRPLGAWMSFQKSNFKFNVRNRWCRKITSEECVISVWKEQLCYCEFCSFFSLSIFLNAQLRSRTARKQWVPRRLVFLINEFSCLI